MFFYFKNIFFKYVKITKNNLTLQKMKKQNTEKEYDLVVVGGGPSGMMMAVTAAKNGAKVLILEKNSSLGKKLKITGGGRCNITNAEWDNKKFLENFPKAKKFLYSPFSKFSAKDTFSFFEKAGLPLVIEARKRAFPKSQKASDVFTTLEKLLKKYKVDISTNSEVVLMKRAHKDFANSKEEKIAYVKLKNGREIFSKNFAIATGGMAAPKTGSTGDGFKFLKKLGHSIDAPDTNIVPLTTDSHILQKISGTAWTFCKISFIQNGKTAFSKTGKILFTHFGLSAPTILNSSHQVKQLLKNGPVTASIDLFPDTDYPNMDKKLLKLFEKNKNKKLKNVLPELLQKNLSSAILEFFPDSLALKKINDVTKEERKSLIKKIKNLDMQITGSLGMDKAVIADGGVSLEEVNFSNMTSKKYSNLYLLGDILNINRPSGGYSLQLCWTTGFVAGKDVAEKINK